MGFKEHSFCRDIPLKQYREKGKSITLTLCSDQFKELIGFNPHNGGGMKKPNYRETTGLGTIGDKVKYLEKIGELELHPDFYYLRNDPHLYYESVYHFGLDLVLYQLDKTSREGITMSDLARMTKYEYIDMLKKWKYNPKDSYFEELKNLYAAWIRGDYYVHSERYREKWIETMQQ
jgi:hypothetical protein